ncbi:MAG TPA: hypothetical protein VFB27_14295 [Opitutaceae bacterium]|nr:hypothetical protein [Opitutaceae bacterium]
MNAPLTSSSVKRTSRARFPHRSSRVATSSTTDASLPATVSLPGFSYASVAEVPEDFFSQIWSPGLLDRLQAPLTRYRE